MNCNCLWYQSIFLFVFLSVSCCLSISFVSMLNIYDNGDATFFRHLLRKGKYVIGYNNISVFISGMP
jgi:hypothetical protein